MEWISKILPFSINQNALLCAAQHHRQKATRYKIKDTKLTTSAKLSVFQALNCPWQETPKIDDSLTTLPCRRKTKSNIPIIPYISNLIHSLTCAKNWRKNTYNWLFLFNLSKLPCRFWSWKKTKAIMHASIKQTLLIFFKCSMVCAWTCPKSWGNWPKRPKILTTYHFSYCLSTPLSRPRSHYKLKTILHAITCDTHIISCNSNISQFLTCPKSTLTAKNT